MEVFYLYVLGNVSRFINKDSHYFYCMAEGLPSIPNATSKKRIPNKNIYKKKIFQQFKIYNQLFYIFDIVVGWWDLRETSDTSTASLYRGSRKNTGNGISDA